jgi:hypothetical protein
MSGTMTCLAGLILCLAGLVTTVAGGNNGLLLICIGLMFSVIGSAREH